MTRFAIHCAVLLAAGWLRADTLETHQSGQDLVDSAIAQSAECNHPATVANARHGDVAATRHSLPPHFAHSWPFGRRFSLRLIALSY